ncbi:ABC transporter substrate-binding protein [Brucella intermedia]|uniref:ABC transporter substrate-binding protein n=1 Tax=Brucella intermedia TaxID=94625 RepID=UPI00235FC54C|nr:ABC transporter substrate-binding protein [Brucella intermedia]
MGRRCQKLLIAGAIVAGVIAPALAAPSSPAISVETSAQAEASKAGQEAAERRAVDLVASLGADALRALQQRPQRRVEAMAALVERYIDLGFVLRSSLPSDLLDALDDRERVVVARAYQAFAAEDYARTFDSYNGEQIDVVSVSTIGPGVARVGTRLRSPEIKDGLAIDWIVAGLDTRRSGLRDLIIEGTSTLASQQLMISTLWNEVGRDKAAFLQRISSPDPWREED